MAKQGAQEAPAPTLTETVRRRLLDGETVDTVAMSHQLRTTPDRVRRAVYRIGKSGQGGPVERVAEGRFRLVPKSASASASASGTATATGSGSATDTDETASDVIRRRLEAGEWVNPDLLAAELGVTSGLVHQILSVYRKQGRKTRASGRKVAGEERHRSFHQLVPVGKTAGRARGTKAGTKAGAKAGRKAGTKGGNGRVSAAQKMDPADYNSEPYLVRNGDPNGEVDVDRDRDRDREGYADGGGGGDADDNLSPRRRSRIAASQAPSLGAKLRVVALALERNDVVVRLEGDGEVWTAVLRK